MSHWAANNPEKYDEIIRRGLQAYLTKLVSEYGFTGEEEEYVCLIDAIQQEPTLRGVYNTLTTLASKEIVDAEQDYFSRLHGY